MKIDSMLKVLTKIEEAVGGDYDLVALDEENNTYELTDIVYNLGLEVYGIKFE